MGPLADMKPRASLEIGYVKGRELKSMDSLSAASGASRCIFWVDDTHGLEKTLVCECRWAWG